MVATMAIFDDGDDPLRRGMDALRDRMRRDARDESARLDRAVAAAAADEDARRDELEPLLIGSLAWQRRERYRAARDKREYTVEGAIKHAYLRIEESKRSIRRMHSAEQDALGVQWHPTVVSIADLEAALTFVPNDRAHNKARWVYALVVGREPVVRVGGGKRVEEGYTEAVPRSIGEAADWLNIPRKDAEEGYKYAEATIVQFLCNEGVLP